jgi:hypothetical protein
MELNPNKQSHPANTWINHSKKQKKTQKKRDGRCNNINEKGIGIETERRSNK